MPNTHDALFRTLADPTRRAIFERLCREGEQTVGALTAHVHREFAGAATSDGAGNVLPKLLASALKSMVSTDWS